MSSWVSADERAAVQDLLMAYVWATDTADAAAYAGTFAPDGVLITSDDERYTGREAIEAYAHQTFLVPGTRGRMHFFQTISYQRMNEFIQVRSFWQVVQIQTASQTGRVRSTGTCDDLCIEINGAFRFSERRIRRWNDANAPWMVDARLK